MEEEFYQSKALSRTLLKELATRNNSDGAIRFAIHYILFLGAGIGLVAAYGQPLWIVLLAMTLFGMTTVPLFAILHESGHNTAFASRTANRVVATVAAFSYFYIPTGFREFHFQHHRHTHDPHKDPEISVQGKPQTGLTEKPLLYLAYLTGLPVLMGKIGMMVTPGLGLYNVFFSYAPKKYYARMGWESRFAILLHGGIIALTLTVFPGLWLIYPGYAIGHMFLSIYLPAEHSGLPHEGSILEKTRHIRTTGFIRFFMWNMPYHAEHHAYPGIPFHALPKLSAAIRNELKEKDKDIPQFQRWMFRRLVLKK
jgi:fatty acid desaturase